MLEIYAKQYISYSHPTYSKFHHLKEKFIQYFKFFYRPPYAHLPSRRARLFLPRRVRRSSRRARPLSNGAYPLP